MKITNTWYDYFRKYCFAGGHQETIIMCFSLWCSLLSVFSTFGVQYLWFSCKFVLRMRPRKARCPSSFLSKSILYIVFMSPNKMFQQFATHNDKDKLSLFPVSLNKNHPLFGCQILTYPQHTLLLLVSLLFF